MQSLFSICQDKPATETVNPEPIKFKLLKAMNLFNPILRGFLLPNKQEEYKFPQDHLHFLVHGEATHIPIVYLPTRRPQTSMVLVYCHGSGSTLNNVYGFGVNMMVKYGFGVVMFDYSGEGQSKGSFLSYENDIKTVLAWVFKQGYSPSRTILCGFSIGSYPALSVPGPIPRVLISPLCGLIPLIEGTSVQYEGQFFDNIKNAQKLKARTMLIHCKQQFIPISHSEVIVQGLSMRNKHSQIDFYKIEGYNHQSAPTFLLTAEGAKVMRPFLRKVILDQNTKGGDKIKGRKDLEWEQYMRELNQIGEQIVVKKSQKPIDPSQLN